MADLAHETRTEAIRRALVERRARLQARAGKPGGRKNLREYLEQNVCLQVQLCASQRRLHQELRQILPQRCALALVECFAAVTKM
ncbi:MAG: hypothetical protein ABSH47_25695 [Bryobacteraceae bacterium]